MSYARMCMNLDFHGRHHRHSSLMTTSRALHTSAKHAISDEEVSLMMKLILPNIIDVLAQTAFKGPKTRLLQVILMQLVSVEANFLQNN